MRGVFGLIVGIVFIAGGLSGQMVLIGTHSGPALAAVGAVLCVINVLRIMQARAS
ncbi:MAG: hypothetical protein JWM57_3333 [Phycisphaerales bacterium]|nr:hypothetical protein [Phycisphaerales bacterium]